jgi:hypothetical protein
METFMNRFIALAPFLFAAVLGSATFAADEQQPAQAGDPTPKEQELTAALKKCDSLASAEKQKCIEAAKKKFGQM